MFNKNEMVTFAVFFLCFLRKIRTENIFERRCCVCFLPVGMFVLEKYLPEVSEATEAEGRRTLLRLREDIF